MAEPHAPAAPPGPPEPGRRGTRLGRLVLAGTVAINLAAAGTVAAFLQQSRAQARAAAEVNTQNLARLLDEGLSDAFDRIDLTLLAVADEVTRQGVDHLDGPALQAALDRHRARTPDVTALRVLDREGTVVRSSPPVEGQVGYGDRDYFAELRDGAPSAVSRPITGRVTQVPLLVFARRLVARDGAFAGAAIGSVELRHVRKLISNPDVGAHGVIAMRAGDLSLVVRTGERHLDAAASPSAVSQELRALLADGRRSATYDAPSPADGVLRTYHFRRLERHPFYLFVGQAPEDYLAGWRRQARVAALVLAAFVALTSAGAWLAWRTQRALQESEARLAATFAAFPDALNISHYETGRYLLVNEGFTRMTGWPAAEVVGRTSAELGLWVDRTERAAALPSLLATGAVDDHEATFRRRDGSLLTGLLSARVITIGGERYLLSITRDLTVQRRLEAQVQQAQRLESVGRLAGGVAHDFNNMLAVILGEAAMLETQLPEGHPAREGLREITRAGERSRDLTRQLLAFSRRQTISPRVVSLNALVEATRPTLARLIGEDVTLVFEPAPGLGPVKLDPGQFDQVLMNLVVNARDAMPHGGRLVLKTTLVQAGAAPGLDPVDLPPGPYALLTVSDDGVGMAPETMAHLFEPFFTTKEPGRGTGLGLATAYGIVRQSGGLIRATSAPGQGTSFGIYLPITSEAPQSPASEGRAAPARGQGTVLLVEDEAQVRRTTRRLLESLGYQVVEAAGGEEALALAAATPFDLLISDVVMPGMKGPELAGRLRALRPTVQVLFISGYAAGALAGQAAPAGALLLQKPFGVEDLARRVQEALEAGRRPA